MLFACLYLLFLIFAAVYADFLIIFIFMPLFSDFR